MAIQEKNLMRAVKEYFLITLGILIYTSGWTIFLTPNNMFGGGVSGISAIIQFATGIKMGYTYFVINALLLLINSSTPRTAKIRSTDPRAPIIVLT